MVAEQVKKLISQQLKVSIDKLSDDARLVEDLDADSANIMVLIMDVEDVFDIQVEDSVITELKTVSDVIAYIEKRIKG